MENSGKEDFRVQGVKKDTGYRPRPLAMVADWSKELAFANLQPPTPLSIT
jgi:hypothetical protein